MPNPKDFQPRKPKGGKLGVDRSFKKDTQEKRVADILKSVGVKRQIGSGAVPGYKGDLVGGFQTITIESKTVTEARSITVKLGVLEKIVKEARHKRSIPALNFGFESARKPIPKDWIAIPADKFKLLVESAGWDCLEED